MTKTVLVSGASTGVGWATSQLFASRGWNVVATMRDPSVMPATASQQIVGVAMDVTSPTSIQQALSQAEELFGSVDVVINNAGHGEFGVFEGITDERIRANFEVNVFGVMNVMRAILPQFRSRGSGMIVNVSSGGGIIGLPATAVYLSTKFALEGFSESIWYELDDVNIQLKIVEPGGVSTPFLDKVAKQSDVNVPPGDYQSFVAKLNKRMRELAWPRSTPEEVAEVIWTSVTDGSRKLRYFHGPGIQHLVDARRNGSDEDYERLMRREFEIEE